MSNKSAKAFGKAYFVIHGEWLTNHVRSLWADENRPDYALKTLQLAFSDMDESLMLSILSGSKKMTGNSTNGINVVDDDAKQSPGGNPQPSQKQIDMTWDYCQKHKLKMPHWMLNEDDD